MVAGNCDGAAVNCGNTSVLTCIQDDEHQYILVMYCIAHWLEIGVRQVVKENEVMKNMGHAQHTPQALPLLKRRWEHSVC